MDVNANWNYTEPESDADWQETKASFGKRGLWARMTGLSVVDQYDPNKQPKTRRYRAASWWLGISSPSSF